MNEFELINRYFSKLSKSNKSSLNLNDDVFFDKSKKLVISVDTYIQGTHFLDFNEPELEFSELEIEENVQKDTVSEDYPRSLKSNREKWLEKYGKHLHPKSNKSFAFR